MCTYLHIIVHLPSGFFSEAKNNTLIFKWLSLLKISMYNYVDISSMCTCILKLVTKILLSQGISYIWRFHLFCKTPSVKSTFSLHWVYIHKQTILNNSKYTASIFVKFTLSILIVSFNMINIFYPKKIQLIWQTYEETYLLACVNQLVQ